MPYYVWKNKKTEEVVEVQRSISECELPPDSTGEWERVYSFGVGRVEGGGGSPSRPSIRREA